MANYSLARPMDFSALDVGRIQEQRQRQEYNALRNEGMRNDLAETERARQDKERVKQIMQSSVKSDGTLDYQALTANLAREGYAEQAMKLDQGLREQQAEQRKAQRQMLEDFSKLAGQVRDQTSLEMFRRAFPNMAEQLPTTYDETAQGYFDNVSGRAAEAAAKLAKRKEERANFLWETETRERVKDKYRKSESQDLTSGEANIIRTIMEMQGASYDEAYRQVKGGNPLAQDSLISEYDAWAQKNGKPLWSALSPEVQERIRQRESGMAMPAPQGQNALAPAAPSPMGATPAAPLTVEPPRPPTQGSAAAGATARVRREARDRDRGDLPEPLRARIERGQVDPRAAANLMEQESRKFNDPRFEKAREEFFAMYPTLPDEQKAAWFIRNQAFLPENAREQIRQELVEIDQRRRLEGAQRSAVPAYIQGSTR